MLQSIEQKSPIPKDDDIVTANQNNSNEMYVLNQVAKIRITTSER